MLPGQVDTRSTPPKHYFGFWGGFYITMYRTGREGIADFLMKLLDGVPEVQRFARVHFLSTFPEGADEPALSESDSKQVLRISFSGESFKLEPTSAYDLNLVMMRTDTSSSVKTVCLPLFLIASYNCSYWTRYAVPRPMPIKKHFCAFVVSCSNVDSRVRERFFYKLGAYKPVTSCGGYMNNCGGMTAPREPEAYFQFLSQFKFMICFENCCLPEYLTEKLHNAWLGHTIPIYWGSRRAREEWLNPEAFLSLPETATEADMDALVARVAELDNDDAKYAAMFAQPLLRESGIPEDWRLESLQARIGEVLRNLDKSHR